MRIAEVLVSGAVVAAVAFAVQSETPTGKVEGRVLNELGMPAAGIRVVAIPLENQNEGQWLRVKAKGDGSFLLKGVEAGKYRLMAQKFKARAEGNVTVSEAEIPALTLKLVTPKVAAPPPIHPAPDPGLVRKRAHDILRARFVLTRELLDTIRKNDRSGLPLPVVLAQAGAESSYRPMITGKLDELGLFQIRPATARDQELGPFTDMTLLQADTNTRLATRQMSRLKLIFKSTRTALAAYNQGEGRTQREGIYPIAQLYADAILMAAYHEQFRARVVQLDPALDGYWKNPRGQVR